MKHDVLGEIRIGERPFDGIASISYGSQVIRIGMSRDDKPFDATVQLAAEVANRLDELDHDAKRAAASHLTDSYNDNWREYDEAQEDGLYRTVSNPRLSEEEFEGKLILRAINVTGDQGIEFFYDNEGMFDGHSVIVSLLDGFDFTNVNVSLFG